MPPSLPIDLLLVVAELLRCDHDYSALAALALVDHAGAEAAAKGLYYEIIIQPPGAISTHIQSFRSFATSQREPSTLLQVVEEEEEEEEEDEGLPEHASDIVYLSQMKPAWLRSSLSARNAISVERLDVGGVLYSESFGEELDRNLAIAIPRYPNLRHIRLSPRFPQTIPRMQVLMNTKERISNIASRLSTLHLENPVAIDEVASWIECDELEVLTLDSPGRTILDMLPRWLEGLQGTLRELHARGGCGSITPSVLRSIAPSLTQITSFSIGISYSISHTDIVAFLGSLPALVKLEMTYHYQMIVPKRVPALKALSCLTIDHQWPSTTRREVNTLCTFIRRLVAGSRLRSLTLRASKCECDHFPLPLPLVSHHPILAHLCSRHFRRLEVLDTPQIFFNRRAVIDLVNRCPQLRELSLTLPKRNTVDGWVFAHNSTSLRSLQIYKRVRLGQKCLSDEEAERVLSHWTSLNKLDVNGVAWEREQGMKSEGLERVVRRMPDAQTPFWDREDAYR